jgi:hypothetical protein
VHQTWSTHFPEMIRTDEFMRVRTESLNGGPLLPKIWSRVFWVVYPQSVLAAHRRTSAAIRKGRRARIGLWLFFFFFFFSFLLEPNSLESTSGRVLEFRWIHIHRETTRLPKRSSPAPSSCHAVQCPPLPSDGEAMPKWCADKTAGPQLWRPRKPGLTPGLIAAISSVRKRGTLGIGRVGGSRVRGCVCPRPVLVVMVAI